MRCERGGLVTFGGEGHLRVEYGSPVPSEIRGQRLCVCRKPRGVCDKRAADAPTGDAAVDVCMVDVPLGTLLDNAIFCGVELDCRGARGIQAKDNARERQRNCG